MNFSKAVKNIRSPNRTNSASTSKQNIQQTNEDSEDIGETDLPFR